MNNLPYNGNLPPGCSSQDIERRAESDERCEACGKRPCKCDYYEWREECRKERLAELHNEQSKTV